MQDERHDHHEKRGDACAAADQEREGKGEPQEDPCTTCLLAPHQSQINSGNKEQEYETAGVRAVGNAGHGEIIQGIICRITCRVRSQQHDGAKKSERAGDPKFTKKQTERADEQEHEYDVHDPEGQEHIMCQIAKEIGRNNGTGPSVDTHMRKTGREERPLFPHLSGQIVGDGTVVAGEEPGLRKVDVADHDKLQNDDPQKQPVQTAGAAK